MRVGAAYTQTGVLAKGRAKGSAGEIEELGRELGLAGACKAGAETFDFCLSITTRFDNKHPGKRHYINTGTLAH